MKILILSVTAGDGHNAMGRAVIEEAKKRGHETLMVDLFKGIDNLRQFLAEDWYFWTLKHFPKFSQRTYNRLKKAANPYAEDYIVRHQLINTSELKLSTLTVVNKEDYKFVQSTFEQNENSQTNNYTRGFINYKVLVCIAMIFSIVVLSYAFIKLYI